MSIPFDQIAVGLLVAGAVLYLARRAFARKKGGSCSAGCGCTATDGTEVHRSKSK